MYARYIIKFALNTEVYPGFSWTRDAKRRRRGEMRLPSARSSPRPLSSAANSVKANPLRMIMIAPSFGRQKRRAKSEHGRVGGRTMWWNWKAGRRKERARAGSCNPRIIEQRKKIENKLNYDEIYRSLLTAVAGKIWALNEQTGP